MAFGIGFCCCCRAKDILFLVDVTGSMGGPLGSLKPALKSIFDSLSGGRKFAVVAFYDLDDAGGVFDVRCNFTGDEATFDAAVDTLEAAGGGDGPEGQFAALTEAASQWESIGGNSDKPRVIVVFGDNRGWVDNSKGHPYPSVADVIDELNAAAIAVCAFGQSSLFADAVAGVNEFAATVQPGKMVELCDETGGSYHADGDAASIEAAICEADPVTV